MSDADENANVNHGAGAPIQSDESDAETKDPETGEEVDRQGFQFGKLLPDASPDGHIADGMRAVSDGMHKLFSLMDRGAQRRRADAADQYKLIEDDLERGELTADERMERLKMGERVYERRGDDEKDIRAAGERTFTKVAAVAGAVVLVVAGAVYLGKDGKLPLDPPTT